MSELRRLSKVFAASMLSVEVLLAGLHYSGEKTEPLSPSPPAEAAPFLDFAAGCKFAPPEDFNQLLVESAGEFGLDPNILAVTVYRESGCDTWAYGAAGEVGLTQITPKHWAQDLRAQGIINRTQELWDPRTNLRASAWILSTHLKGDEDEYQMFRRYNGRGAKARKYAREQQVALQELRLSLIPDQRLALAPAT